MKLSTFVVGVLMLAVVVVGLSTIVADGADTMNVTVDTAFNSTYDKINDISDDVNSTSSRLQGGSIDTADALFTLSVSAWQGAKIVFNSFDIFGSILTAIATELNVPRWLLTAIISMVLITLTFLLISLVFRYNA